LALGSRLSLLREGRLIEKKRNQSATIIGGLLIPAGTLLAEVICDK
jgi:hypothetical protein